MNQSQFLAITCNSLEAREKSRVHGAIGFGFASHWLKTWRESFKPITKRSSRNHVITFDSHLKTALVALGNKTKFLPSGRPSRVGICPGVSWTRPPIPFISNPPFSFSPTDINECSLEDYVCNPLAECINSIGSYSCRCYDGYTGNGKVNCVGGYKNSSSRHQLHVKKVSVRSIDLIPE